MSVVLCGNVGDRDGSTNGQTYKTRVVFEELTNRLPERPVQLIDTSYMLSRPLRILFSLRRALKQTEALIIMPGMRGLYVFSFFLAKWNRHFRKRIYFVVVGGWLPEYLRRHNRLRTFCVGLDGVYPEIPSMARALEKQGLRNVEVVPNFRRFERQAELCLKPERDEASLKTCFYSRVLREKGIEDAMEAVRLANQAAGQARVTLDIFGPVDRGYRRRFTRLLLKYPEHRYHGALSPTNPYQTLEAYDLMLFPTFYEGEGFPGAVVDAFVAGLPVIASDWRYNREVIEAGRTGLLVNEHDIVGLANKINDLATDRVLLHSMKQNAWNAAQPYHTDSVFPWLLRDMGLS